MSSSSEIQVVGNASGRPQAGGHQWALRQWALGLSGLGVPAAFSELAQPAGVVLSLMGFAGPRPAGAPAEYVFVDIDPGYPQMWHALGLADPFSGHDRFVTIGENLTRSSCLIPDCGREWITTPPPVVLDEWPVTPPGHHYTSVATWRNAYGSVDFKGVTYGSRVHEFRPFFDLPRITGRDFELALDIDAAEVDDRRRLQDGGWQLVDPRAVAGTPDSYRSYLQHSRAEFSIAQEMYVRTRSGWLSDRSLCYLASGKPVIAQDTGFSDNYPVGEGLLAFTDLDGAAAAVEAVESDYERHSRAARALAEEYFDARRVLSALLSKLEIRLAVHV